MERYGLGGQPNVILVVVDCLRRDFVGCCGSDEGLTPKLDERLAESSVQFDRCFSNGPLTLSSISSMMTSTHPLEYGGETYLAEDRTTWAEVFGSNGYTTGAIHSNPTLMRERNFDRGFDDYDDDLIPQSLSGVRGLSEQKLLKLSNLFRKIRRIPYLEADDINHKAREWIADRTEPYFLWLQYMDVHGPYFDRDSLFPWYDRYRSQEFFRRAIEDPDSITEAEKDRLENLYADDVRYTDEQLSQLIDWLDESGHLDNTILVVTADHGEEFEEHGMFDHMNQPHAELTSVPLLIQFPSRYSRRVEQRVSLIDLLPTLADIADLDVGSMAEQQRGRSLRPLFEDGDDAVSTTPIYIERSYGQASQHFAIIEDGWKYMIDTEMSDEMLFNLDEDPGEQIEVSAQHPDVLDRFRTLYESHRMLIHETSSSVEIPSIEVEAEVEERLEDLGYLDDH